jgi:hypothetical protein
VRELQRRWRREREATIGQRGHAASWPTLSCVQLGSLASCVTLSSRRKLLLIELHWFVNDKVHFHELVDAQLTSMFEKEDVHREVAKAERQQWLEQVSE